MFQLGVLLVHHVTGFTAILLVLLPQHLVAFVQAEAANGVAAGWRVCSNVMLVPWALLFALPPPGAAPLWPLPFRTSVFADQTRAYHHPMAGSALAPDAI